MPLEDRPKDNLWSTQRKAINYFL